MLRHIIRILSSTRDDTAASNIRQEVLAVCDELDGLIGGMNSTLQVTRDDFTKRNNNFWASVQEQWVVGQKKTVREWGLTTVYQAANNHFDDVSAYVYRGTLSISGQDALALCTACLDLLVKSDLIEESFRQEMLQGIDSHIKMNG